MNPKRLDALADGIFAIVMTLLVFDISASGFSSGAGDHALLQLLLTEAPSLLAFVVSFAVLFTYWRAHHYIMGIYAKTVDIHLMNINGLFFLLVALVPFSASVLGNFSDDSTAIAIFGGNVIALGVVLWWMRARVLFTDHIDSVAVGRRELRHGTMRTLVPPMFAALAIIISAWNTRVSLVLFTLAVLFNLLPESTRLADWLFGFRE